MATLNCRDAGPMRDFSLMSDDLKRLMATDLKHGTVAHKEDLVRLLREQKPRELVYSMFKDIKGDMSPQRVRAACVDFGLACVWSMSSDHILATVVETLKHWEEVHPEELKAELAKSGWEALSQFVINVSVRA